MPSQYLLDAYEPRRYMRYFEEITRIPKTKHILQHTSEKSQKPRGWSRIRIRTGTC